jgi:putative FmdB family regulatory protein
MPLYDYKCSEHGLFHELVAMEDHAMPQPCPTCKAASGRIIIIPPDLLAMPETDRKANQINERNQHEPIKSTIESRDTKHGRCCGAEKENKRSGKAIFLADGSKIFPSMRPWMISH